jgi:hypothetical protein
MNLFEECDGHGRTFRMTEAVLAVVWPKWLATCEARSLVCVHRIQSANAAALSQFFICVLSTMIEITVAMGQLSLLGPAN